ncbi:MAG TPA: hypothetical protein DIT04_01995, partial [Dysgonomonas sp.]|nr:hypothetical protein [Dysgonomonas sp.]
MREALSTAILAEFNVKNSDGTRSSVYKDVDESSIKSIGTDTKPSYYIINYKDNAGWVIIAADKRVNPIMAYSTEGNFDIDAKELPGGLLEWLENSDTYVKKIRKSEEPVSELRAIPHDNPCLLRAIIVED